MAEDMITRAAKALYDCESVRAGHSAKVIAGIARGPRDVGIEPFEECAETTWLPDARHALLAALDPEDESLVSAFAQRLADDATVARNELRLIRQGIDLSSAEPVSPSIFKKDARVMIATLKAMAQGEQRG